MLASPFPPTKPPAGQEGLEKSDIVCDASFLLPDGSGDGESATDAPAPGGAAQRLAVFIDDDINEHNKEAIRGNTSVIRVLFSRGF